MNFIIFWINHDNCLQYFTDTCDENKAQEYANEEDFKVWIIESQQWLQSN